ncbi:hypothetical protein [Bradyrhizobium sp. STM 3561]|uniref:hypothetical protein n=1 Tax=Bradyrhizobium sp. STM 3561 TaxID=578923 RepID=UPI00389042D4
MKVASKSVSVRPSQLHLCEHELQPDRVPVGGDRVGVNIVLAHEALGEEALNQRGDIAGGLHGVTSYADRDAAPLLPIKSR